MGRSAVSGYFSIMTHRGDSRVAMHQIVGSLSAKSTYCCEGFG